ncbi:MAG: helix-hairpin-helix domain-containing protein [Deltaproteobacteria bacterium]|nr:helix-hairpin-helix domain-containing protein [Deltaproteobacteria bacterium]
MEEKNLVKKQIYGAIGIVVIVVFLYAARDVSQYAYSSGGPVACCEYEKPGIMVMLAGDEDHDGIYSLSQEATVYDLFKKAGLPDIAGFKEADLARALHSGDRVTCDGTRYRVTLGDVAVPVRLAFGMPVDLNEATLEELILIPGIGLITASKIIEVREANGAFPIVDSLKLAGCMGEGRYNRVKDYLYIRASSP